MKNDTKKVIGIAVVCGIFLALLIVFWETRPANAAEPITALSCPADTVSFTDAVDLIRKVDAVMAVKDTTFFETHPPGIDNDYRWIEIRHRRLVGVMVMRYVGIITLDTPLLQDPLEVAYGGRDPGTAVVWFEWEVR